ncbi:carboxypeptidase-like regulatory domain-containing protein [Aquimarina sp. MMG016]|uniref:carboxypeptidase-like regulatory domain-containing protein n=1 Tax=Aquimarina sp. MMG016 TaxID=2822690 RepID=UPI001B3A1BAD|nr:carboxypeptidase-like regulatory domain-containing protein [Aquimarina sp. MMG016]MBQ4822050.1 carboxypeptidase-like regulatory domain-containing protein [Aquimarina sp. MMG016]
MTLQKAVSALILLFFTTLINAQSISSRVVDKKTNKPVSYATIQLSENTGIITNEEGRFSITLEDTTPKSDSIYISSMGYEKLGISIKSTIDSIIYINPKAIELSGVFVSNKNLTVDEIIDNAKDNLEKNYDLDLTKKRLFFRETNNNYMNKLEIKFKESSIEELDKKLIDSIVQVIPRNSQFFAEALCDFYGNEDQQKLHVVKGARLYDKNNTGSLEGLYKKLEKIFKDNVKPNSYLKIKSGIFSQKVQVDSILNANKSDGDKENIFFKSRKMNITNLFNDLFFQRGTKLDVIRKSGRYEFEHTDFTSIGENSVYIVNFSPKWRGDFKGTLYINTEDFAVMRIDFQNVKSLRKIKLLGFSFEEKTYKGKAFFTKGSDGKYGLRFIEKSTGNKIGVDRPLKVIEKNKYVKGRRKQNELSLDLDVVSTLRNKYEIVVFDSNRISEAQFNDSKENKNVKATYLSKYDPNFWKGYNIIEPNQAIKEFSAPEEN